MEVLVLPTNPTDFSFNSSAYASAQSTPKPIGDCYFSAPTSPTRVTDLHHEFDDLSLISDDVTHQSNFIATVPFAWEEKPGVPKSFNNGGMKKSAAEMEPPPPAAAAAMRGNKNEERERGRERNYSGLSSSRSRRTRSLPPVAAAAVPNMTALAASGSGKGSRKWSFKDLFLFRSASDGRAMDRDPFKKYSAIVRKHDEDLRSDRSGSGSGSSRRGRVSAHELHYKVNRAVSNDMKKKSFLPYKQGILGRLAFNPTVNALSNGFGFSHNN